MARARDPEDWDRDLQRARETEQAVHAALAAHPAIARLADGTDQMEPPDFTFRFEREDVRLELKEKLRPSSLDIQSLWPEVPHRDLAIVDEVSFRKLLWGEGLGYLLIRDRPGARWAVFGPWELCLGPRRRFQRLGDRGHGAFLKGKLLIDLRSAAVTTPTLDIDALLKVVRSSRVDVSRVEAVRLRMDGELPVVPLVRSRPRPSEPTLDAAEPPAEASMTIHDPSWFGLSNELVAAVRTRWGWDRPTPVQALAFPAVLSGDNVLVVGPTAGGKTEAAMLPLLDRWLHRGWAAQRPSILVVNPMKALLDDQLVRWQQAGALLGATGFAWHGDVPTPDRNAFRARPADILLTTPESLERFLASPGEDEMLLLGGLRAVVVDEVHAFTGSPRGAQLAGLLERVDRFTADDLQRVGLSATVGSPAAVLSWLSGGSHRDARAVDGGPPMRGEIVEITACADLNETASAIAAATIGRRSLVFTSSRRRCEELAHRLRLPAYHSSVAAETRRLVLRQLRSGEHSSVVATTSLEMGIDVGDLDMVVLDAAPSGPASYLQRIGRAGRRTGERRVAFTIADVDDLLQVLAVILRARRGDVGDAPPGRGARLVLGQQIMSMVLQWQVRTTAEVLATLQSTPVFRQLRVDVEATIKHLIAGDWLLQVADETLTVGKTGNARFGGPQGINRLLATFDGAGGVEVRGPDDGLIGTIDREKAKVGLEFVLAGCAWRVTSVDESGSVRVDPTGGGRPMSWRGGAIDIERRTFEAVREILGGTDVPAAMDRAATAWLADARSRWMPRLEAPIRTTPEGVIVDTFAGESVNRSILRMLGVDGKTDGVSIEAAVDLPLLRARATHALNRLGALLETEAATHAQAIRLAQPELTAPTVLIAEARQYKVDEAGIRAVLELISH